jgi:hypothetical protein
VQFSVASLSEISPTGDVVKRVSLLQGTYIPDPLLLWPLCIHLTHRLTHARTHAQRRRMDDQLQLEHEQV